MAESTAQGPRSAGGLQLSQFRGAAMLLMFSILAARGLGYLREAYIAAAFGAGRNTDAYYVAFAVPDLLSYLVAGGALSITFIPILDALRESNREGESNRILSIVATFMLLILISGTLIAEYFAAGILHWYQPNFTVDEFQLCLTMTRILLACPLFICLGGLFSARLYTRGAFLIPAVMPLVYNIGTLGGGILLGRRIGVTSLAIGTVAGAVVGMFLLPLIGAVRYGIRYRPCFDLGDPYFQKWLKTTIPLMLGVSIVTADDYFIRYFAGGTAGAISLLNYAKRLTGVPIAVLGQAIGQAAMPFFSSLANSGDWAMFRETVDRSVTRMVLAGIFAISLLESLSLGAVRLVYEHGQFTDADAHASALYFAIFVVTLIFWISQGIYARAFYATGNTFAPMLQSTIVSLLTLPVYRILMDRFGIPGLAWASDFAIVCQTLTLALLLHRRGLLYLDRARWMEIGRAVVAAVLAWFVAAGVFQWIEPSQYVWTREVGAVAVISLVWLGAIVILSRVFRLHSATAEAMSILKKLRLA